MVRELFNKDFYTTVRSKVMYNPMGFNNWSGLYLSMPSVLNSIYDIVDNADTLKNWTEI